MEPLHIFLAGRADVICFLPGKGSRDRVVTNQGRKDKSWLIRPIQEFSNLNRSQRDKCSAVLFQEPWKRRSIVEARRKRSRSYAFLKRKRGCSTAVFLIIWHLHTVCDPDIAVLCLAALSDEDLGKLQHVVLTMVYVLRFPVERAVSNEQPQEMLSNARMPLTVEPACIFYSS